MPRKKVKFNSKILKRFKVKELKNFMKQNKLPIEGKLSKLRKAEIVSQLIRLQRVELYNKAFDNLEIKPAKERTEAQKLAFAKARQKLEELNIKTKQAFPKSKEIDKQPNIERRTKEQDFKEEIKQEAAHFVNQNPTELQLVKQGGEPQSIENLEDLFVFSNKKLDKQREKFLSLILKRKEETTGTQTVEQPAEPVKEPVEKEVEVVSEKKKSEADKDLFETVFKNLNKEEIKEILKNNKIEFNNNAKKFDLVNLIVNNKKQTVKDVNKKIKDKKDKILKLKKKRQEKLKQDKEKKDRERLKKLIEEEKKFDKIGEEIEKEKEEEEEEENKNKKKKKKLVVKN